MSFMEQLLHNKGTHKRQIATPPDPPKISMDTFHSYKSRLVEHYQKDPKFHAIVDNFHHSILCGDITSEALFDAIFLAKEIFILNREDRIRSDLEWDHQHRKENP